MHHQLVLRSTVHWYRWIEIHFFFWNSSAYGGIEARASWSCLYNNQCLWKTLFLGHSPSCRAMDLCASKSLNFPICVSISPSFSLFPSLPFPSHPQTGLRFVSQQAGLKPATLPHPLTPGSILTQILPVFVRSHFLLLDYQEHFFDVQLL